MPETSSRVLYYPVWISPGRKSGGWSWGPPCETRPAAAAILADRIAGGAPLGTLVRLSGGIKTPLGEHTLPREHRKVLAHWEDLWTATESD